MTDTLFSIVRDASVQVDELGHKRSLNSVLLAAQAELGECADEVLILSGDSYKTTGPDGVIGEAIDAIACLLDAIYVTDPDFTEQMLNDYMKLKCQKWIDKEASFRQLKE